MGIWGLIGSAGNIISGIAGNNIQQMAGIEGAQRKADIQKKSRKFQEKVIDEQVKRFKPYWRQGKRAISELEEMEGRRGDVYNPSQDTQSMIRESENYLRGQGQNRGDFNENTYKDLREEALIAGRGMERDKRFDYIDVGMGAAGKAGRLKPDRSQRIMNVGTDLAQAQQNYRTRQQNMISKTADRASGFPAYAAYGNALGNSGGGGGGVSVRGASQYNVPKNKNKFQQWGQAYNSALPRKYKGTF